MADETGLPVGTVPIYEAARRGMERSQSTRVELDADEMLAVVASQADHGAAYMAIHVGLNRKTLEVWRRSPRNIVSKGGYLTAEYMLRTGRENPFYERFDDLLDILRAKDVVLNIGTPCARARPASTTPPRWPSWSRPPSWPGPPRGRGSKSSSKGQVMSPTQ